MRLGMNKRFGFFIVLLSVAVSLCVLFSAGAAEAASSDTTVSDTAPSAEQSRQDARAHVKDPSIAIIFTNDVHSYFDRDIGYDGLMLLKQELEQQYEYVVLVDAGDAIQGAPLGSLSQGKEPVQVMNEVGYDVAILGNHEFDYGVDVLDDLAEQLKCGYICCDFCTPDGATVYEPYKILTFGDTRVAFVGVDTPTTFSKSSLHDLIDDQGEPMYDFKTDESGGPLYACVQETVDEVRGQNVDYVILVAHLGQGLDAPEAFRSNVVISHLKGVDAVIDGHSHQVYNTTALDADGNEIPVVQTGCNFHNAGTMILHPDHSITVTLYDEIPAPEDWMEGIDVVTVTRGDRERYVEAGMHQFLENVTASYADVMNRKVGEVAFDMLVGTEEDPNLSRHSENGLGNLVVDAFREAGQTDIGILNAGSVRNSLPAGEITFRSVLNVLPYSNNAFTAEVKGQTILDALEFGCRKVPGADNGFLQVSGIEFTLDLSKESPVVTDENEAFLRVEGERRVSNVLINGEPLDPEAIYTVTAPEFLITGGDNFTMFAEDTEGGEDQEDVESTENVEDTEDVENPGNKDGVMNLKDIGKTDNVLLAEYIENNLGGVIPESYQKTGERIHVLNAQP